jgi:N-acetylglutamate synthase-like GNAT family acetyltransferase
MDHAAEIVYLADCPEVIPQLAAWQQAQFGYLSPGRAVEERIQRFHTHIQRRAIPTTFVARIDGAPAGSASLVVRDMSLLPDLTPWLAGVYISPAYRRAGVGTALVRRVAQEARTLGIERLYLYTHDRMSFYRSLGWQEIAPYVYRGYLVTVMACDPFA